MRSTPFVVILWEPLYNTGPNLAPFVPMNSSGLKRYGYPTERAAGIRVQK